MSKRPTKYIERVTDHEGNTTETQKWFTVDVDSNDFYITYIGSISGVLKIKKISDARLLAVLCCSADFNKGTVSLTPKKRREIMEIIGCTKQNISDGLKRLREIGLISGEGGDVTINPQCFWKGSESERKKLISGQGLSVNLNFKNVIDKNRGGEI